MGAGPARRMTCTNRTGTQCVGQHEDLKRQDGEIAASGKKYVSRGGSLAGKKLTVSAQRPKGRRLSNHERPVTANSKHRMPRRKRTIDH
eukprot:scaffold17460_cov128-Isochrysis_galbana.AAC.13